MLSRIIYSALRKISEHFTIVLLLLEALMLKSAKMMDVKMKTVNWVYDFTSWFSLHFMPHIVYISLCGFAYLRGRHC